VLHAQNVGASQRRWAHPPHSRERVPGHVPAEELRFAASRAQFRLHLSDALPAPAGRERGVSDEDGGFEGGAGDDEQGGHGADDGVHDGFRFDAVGGWAVDEWTDGKTVNGGRAGDGRGAAVGVSPFCCGTGPDPVGPVRLA